MLLSYNRGVSAMLKNLRLLREEAGLSQKQLADRIGVSQQSINKYENHNVEPDIATLMRMADCFSTSVDYIIGYSEERTPILPNSAYELSSDEISVLCGYRALSEKRKTCLKLLLDTYNEQL